MSSPSTSRTIASAASSCSAETDAKTLVSATPSTEPARGSRNRRSSSPSSGTISRPSNSMPPPTMASPAETAARRSSGHIISGGTAVVDGRPMRATATRSSPAALEHRVGGVRRPEHHVGHPAGLDSGGREDGVDRGGDAAADVGRGRPLRLGDQPVGAVEHDGVGVRAADVDAEPQVDRRAHADELLHRDVVEVVAERPRPGQREAGLRAPHRVAGERHDRHPLAVAEPLGVDRVAGLRVEHGDDVRHHRPRAAALERDQVLVLDLQLQQPAAVLLQPLDGRRAADEAARHAALDVRQLAVEQQHRADRLAQRPHRVVGSLQRPADPQGTRDRAADGGLAGAGRPSSGTRRTRRCRRTRRPRPSPGAPASARPWCG